MEEEDEYEDCTQGDVEDFKEEVACVVVEDIINEIDENIGGPLASTSTAPHLIVVLINHQKFDEFFDINRQHEATFNAISSSLDSKEDGCYKIFQGVLKYEKEFIC